MRRLVRSRRNTGVFSSPALSPVASPDEEADEQHPLNAVLSGSPQVAAGSRRLNLRRGPGGAAAVASRGAGSSSPSMRRAVATGTSRLSPANAASSVSIGSPSVVAVQVEDHGKDDSPGPLPARAFARPSPGVSSFADRPVTPADFQQCIAAMNSVREDLHQVVSRLRAVEERSLSQSSVRP